MCKLLRKTGKKVKMNNFLVCPCKSQDFAQSQKNCAQLHAHETVTFRNSVYTVYCELHCVHCTVLFYRPQLYGGNKATGVYREHIITLSSWLIKQPLS